MRKIVLYIIVAIVASTIGCARSAGEDTTRPTAEQIYYYLAANDFPIGNVVLYDEATDENNLLGRPGQYTSKVNFEDQRTIKEYVDITSDTYSPENTIEVFNTKEDMQKRLAYLDTILSSSSILYQYMYNTDTVIIRLANELLPSEAQEYERLLLAADSDLSGVLSAPRVDLIVSNNETPPSESASPSPSMSLSDFHASINARYDEFRSKLTEDNFCELLTEYLPNELAATDKVIDVVSDNGALIISLDISASDPKPLTFTDIAEQRVSFVTDFVLKFEELDSMWDTIIVNFPDIGNATFGKADIRDNGFGGRFFSVQFLTQESTPTTRSEEIGLDIEYAEFRTRVNKALKSFEGGLQLGDLNLNESTATAEINEHIAYGLFLNTNGNIASLMMIGSGDGSMESGLDIMIALGATINAVDPSIAMDQTGTIILKMTDGETYTSNGIKMMITQADSIGTILSISKAA